MIVTAVEAPTALVEMANTAVADPPATVTVDGTLATPALLEESATAAPAAGAAPESVMTPCEPVPPSTVSGLATSRWTVGPAGGAPAGVTVSVPVFEPPLNEAVIVTVVVTETATS